MAKIAGPRAPIVLTDVVRAAGLDPNHVTKASVTYGQDGTRLVVEIVPNDEMADVLARTGDGS